MLKKKYYIGLSYIHPICPLNASHTRVFVVADVWARYKRLQGFEVKMPFASHYSGNTAPRLSLNIKRYLKGEINEDIDKNIKLFRDFYKVQDKDLMFLTEPLSLLNYYSIQTIEDLKKIGVSCDWQDYYNTKDIQYENFVIKFFDEYKKRGLIIDSDSGRILDYQNKKWKTDALNQEKATKIISREWAHIIRDSIHLLDNNWTYEREDGIGVNIDGKIVDPMYDSELFTFFDVLKNCLDCSNEKGKREISKIFDLLNYKINDKEFSYQKTLQYLDKWLPVNIFLQRNI